MAHSENKAQMADMLRKPLEAPCSHYPLVSWILISIHFLIYLSIK
jgi:hypothetical protein